MTPLILAVLFACSGQGSSTVVDTGTEVACEPDVEVCDGLDNDCDGEIDNAATDQGTLYADVDGDGFGDEGTAILGCEGTSGFVADPGDCDDGDGLVNPDAPEVCDDVDNDCDTLIDDEDDSLDLSSIDPSYPDADGDGYGESSGGVWMCLPPSDYTADGSDCDDSDPWVHPDAEELCDGKATDCDAGWISDAGLASFYSDASGVWTDLTAELSAGSSAAPATYAFDEAGALGICEGTWHVALSISQAVQVVGVDGAEAVVLTGDDSHSIVSISGDEAAAVLSRLTLEQGLADHTVSFGDDTRDAGGAIWCSGGGSLSLDGVVLRDNVSTGYGGALASEGCQLTLSGVQATGNRAYHGGALVTSGSSLTVSDSVFDGNTADVEGGGFYLGGGVSLSLVDSSFSGNEAYQGGAIRSEERGLSGANDLTLTDSSFTGSVATLGGAVAADDGGSVVITGSTFSANQALESGGALLLDVGTLTLTNSVFESNESIKDGGAASVVAGLVTLDSSRFVGNTGEDGGALDLKADRTVLTDTVFEDNVSTRSGAAVAVRAEGAGLDATGVSFSGNAADRDGGAVYASDGARFACDACTFNDNNAQRSGGAVGVEVADLVLKNTTVTDNRAGGGRMGGGVWVDNGSVSIDTVTFSGNRSGSGGAIGLELADGTIGSSSFQDNIADDGGAVYMSLSELMVRSSDFSGNSPTDTYVLDADQSSSWGNGADFDCDLAGCQ